MANLVQEQELFFTAFEPKMRNRFILYADGMPSFMVKKVTRPKLTQEAKAIDHINLQRYVKGKTIWDEMSMTLYDAIVPSAAQSIMEWVRLHHESVTGRDGYLEFYKKDLTLAVLGPVGDKIEEWILKGTQITQVDFGEMDWSDDNVLEFTIGIRSDYVVLNY